MSNHAWCRDTARDERIRAAEDGRQCPLPTLAEAIAAQFACAACGGYGMDHRCKESCEECDGEGRAMLPKSVSASSAVDHENKGGDMAVTDCRSADTKGDEMSHGSAQAASGGGVSSSPPISAAGKSAVEETPVAWMCEWTDHLSLHQSKFVAEVVANGDVVPQPLYRSPPQPRGWLTEEERGSIQHAATCAKSSWSYSLAQELENILARSSPPEVRLPLADLGDRLLRDGVIDALAAAGVRVKEVGR